MDLLNYRLLLSEREDNLLNSIEKKNDKCLHKSLFEDFQVKFSQCRLISKKFHGKQVKSSPKVAK